MPERLQLSRAKGWRLPAGARSVARPSRWGNPYEVGMAGVRFCGATRGWPGYYGEQVVGCDSELPGKLGRLNAEQAVALYRSDLLFVLSYDGLERSDGTIPDEDKARVDRLRADLEALRGLDLACWCPIGQPCHADVLIELANR